MAKLLVTLDGTLEQIRSCIVNGIVHGSVSASMEDESRINGEHARCCVLVFERYSWVGGNRVSLNVTLFQEQGSPVRMVANTAGGSQAMFWKVNTLGEGSFLQKLEELLVEAGHLRR
ncbi:MAG: DUF6054 family protein [Eubacteriales bacterium]|nr:DUF6054 family protein [Eubacteriales bacterium]